MRHCAREGGMDIDINIDSNNKKIIRFSVTAISVRMHTNNEALLALCYNFYYYYYDNNT